MIIKRKRKRINNINELKNSNYRKIRIKKKNKIYSIKKYIPKFKYIAILLIALYLTILNICRKSNYISNKDDDLLAEEIYKSKGELNYNKLKKISIDYSKYNKIHIALTFNNDYYLLASVTIATILRNIANTTFVFIHIIESGDFIYETRKKINSLREKLNNNSEFIFHNGSKVMDDFGKEIKNQPYGVGEYSRLMAPDLVEDDRILVVDSGDIMVIKDLVELYNIDLKDKLVWGALDPYAKCHSFNKENYINGGVLLFNAKKWRELGIYKDIVNFYKAFNFKGKLGLPIQDILNTFIPYLSVGILPLRYNYQYHPYLSADCVVTNNEENEDAKNNEVIRHNNKMKPYQGEGELSKWYYYANLTGFIKDICAKYPKGCN